MTEHPDGTPPGGPSDDDTTDNLLPSLADDATVTPASDPPEPLLLHYSAISDVGRVRKDNQDSGYAGPWLLTVCDGVGGAARGDIASGTAVGELRNLDVGPPDSPSLLDRVSDGLHEAHAEIGRLVDADPAISGTSTTATLALFDGRRIGIGHVGDSRAYLFREGEISQLTVDHTFVQSLIDEGRITAEEARVHPHRNLILKALDGVHEAEPDLFVLELVAGDRLFLCSDGACGVLDDGRLADILSMGTPDFAAVELVRASLEAGSSDNVTCIVADVRTEADASADPDFTDLQPLLVGAAAELRRRSPLGGKTAALFRGHRSGDTGELEPIEAEIPEEVGFAIPSDPIDPEAARYAPGPPPRFVWPRRVLALAVVVGLFWIAAAGAWSYVQGQYYLGVDDGVVVIYRGVGASVPGLDLSDPVERTTLEVSDLRPYDVSELEDGNITASDLAEAKRKVEDLAGKRMPPEETVEPDEDVPTDEPTSGSTTDPTEAPTDGQTPGDSGGGIGLGDAGATPGEEGTG